MLVLRPNIRATNVVIPDLNLFIANYIDSRAKSFFKENLIDVEMQVNYDYNLILLFTIFCWYEF